MDKTTTLMIRAACGVVLAVPVFLGGIWVVNDRTVKFCAAKAYAQLLFGAETYSWSNQEIWEWSPSTTPGYLQGLALCKVKHPLPWQ